MEELVKNLNYDNLIRWIKDFHLLQGLIINNHFELENSRKIAIKFINIPNVDLSDKFYLEMIKPATTLEEFLKSSDMNKFVDKCIRFLPFIKKSIKSDNLKQKGSNFEKNDLTNLIHNASDGLEIVEYSNIISLYDILEAEQQRKIDIILNRQDNFKIIMTGIVDLKDLNNNNTEHYKRINVEP